MQFSFFKKMCMSSQNLNLKNCIVFIYLFSCKLFNNFKLNIFIVKYIYFYVTFLLMIFPLLVWKKNLIFCIKVQLYMYLNWIQFKFTRCTYTFPRCKIVFIVIIILHYCSAFFFFFWYSKFFKYVLICSTFS